MLGVLARLERSALARWLICSKGQPAWGTSLTKLNNSGFLRIRNIVYNS